MNTFNNLLSLPKEQSNIIPLNTDKEIIQEIERIEKKEIVLPLDHIDSIKRRILIGIKAFGIHQPSAIAGYAGIPLFHYDQLMKETGNESITELIKNPDIIPCLTKGEILAMLSVEAQNSPKPNDRIKALSLLMEYRGFASSDSRSFARIIARYQK